MIVLLFQTHLQDLSSIILCCKRSTKLYSQIKLIKPDVVLLFTADKSSAIEKGLMILISKLVNIPVMVFPRAGALKNQYLNNKLLKIFLNFIFSKADVFLCQGKSFQEFAIKKLNFSPRSAP